MAKSKKMTSDEYVTQKLIETEAKLEEANHHIRTLNEDLDAFITDLENIRKVFHIEYNCSKTEYKIVCSYDPDNGWKDDVIAFSGSLDPEKFDEKFAMIKKVLRLETPEERELPDLEDIVYPEPVKPYTLEYYDSNANIQGTEEFNTEDEAYAAGVAKVKAGTEVTSFLIKDGSNNVIFDSTNPYEVK